MIIFSDIAVQVVDRAQAVAIAPSAMPPSPPRDSLLTNIRRSHWRFAQPHALTPQPE